MKAFWVVFSLTVLLFQGQLVEANEKTISATILTDTFIAFAREERVAGLEVTWTQGANSKSCSTDGLGNTCSFGFDPQGSDVTLSYKKIQLQVLGRARTLAPAITAVRMREKMT